MNHPNWQSLLAAFLSPTSLTLLVIGGLVVIVVNTFFMRWALKQLRSEPGDDAELAGNTGVSNAIVDSSTRVSTVGVPRKSSLRPRGSAGERAATPSENVEAAPVPALTKAPAEVPVTDLVEIEPVRPVKLTSFEPLVPFTPSAMPEGSMVASNEPVPAAKMAEPVPVTPLEVAAAPVTEAKPIEAELPEPIAPAKDPAPARELPVADVLTPSLISMIADPVHPVEVAAAPVSATIPPLAVTVPQEKTVAPVVEISPMHVEQAIASGPTLPPDGALVMPPVSAGSLVETTTTSAEKAAESIDAGLLKPATPPAPPALDLPEVKVEEPVKTTGRPRVFLPANVEAVPESAAPEITVPVEPVPEPVAEVTPEPASRVFLPAVLEPVEIAPVETVRPEALTSPEVEPLDPAIELPATPPDTLEPDPVHAIATPPEPISPATPAEIEASVVDANPGLSAVDARHIHGAAAEPEPLVEAPVAEIPVVVEPAPVPVEIVSKVEPEVTVSAEVPVPTIPVAPEDPRDTPVTEVSTPVAETPSIAPEPLVLAPAPQTEEPILELAPASLVTVTPQAAAAPAQDAIITTHPSVMTTHDSTTSLPPGGRASAQLTLGFEVTSLQLTPFFKLGAVQLRSLSNIVSLHLLTTQQAENPLAAGISFQIEAVDLNESAHIRSILLKPLPQAQAAATPQPKLQVDNVQLGQGSEGAPIQVTSSQGTSTAVQLLATCTIVAMDFTPSFEIGSLRLEPTSNFVLLRSAPSQRPAALDLPPSFEVANVQLEGNAQIASVRLTPGAAK